LEQSLIVSFRYPFRRQAEKKLAASVSIHRPVAHLKIAVERGRNIRSRELGLPGSLNASVTWIPDRTLSQAEKDRLKQYDSLTPFNIGTATNSGVTSNPIWRGIMLSDEALRLKQLIYGSKAGVGREKGTAGDSALSSSQSLDDSSCFVLPILQPVTLSFDDRDGQSAPVLGLRLLPWESSSGAILVQVRFDNVFNKLLVFEDVLGEVEIQLTQLLDAKTNENGEKELEGWFPLQTLGGSESIDKPDVLTSLQGTSVDTYEDKPEIFVRARLSLPQSLSSIADSDQEMSVVVAEEMIRSSTLSNNNKIGVIGSSINTINTVGGLFGNIQMIQNQMGRILDIIESVINALTWAVSILVLHALHIT